MFTSVINERRKLLRQAYMYLGVTVFCGIFSAIYESFSHGVYSASMIFMFVYPLFGLAISLMFAFTRLPVPRRFVRNSYNSSIAAFTVGSCISGVLEIYGTTSYYNFAYTVIGIILIVASVTGYFVTYIKSR